LVFFPPKWKINQVNNFVIFLFTFRPKAKSFLHFQLKSKEANKITKLIPSWGDYLHSIRKYNKV
jgi:hypothetical protein